MDLLLLKALSDKKRYKSLLHAVPSGMIASTTQSMLQYFGLYFEAFPERTEVHPDELASLLTLRVFPNATPEQAHLIRHLCGELEQHTDPASVQGILGQLHELDLSGRVGALLTKYNNGEEVQLAYELSKLSTSTVRSMSQSAPTDYIDTDIGVLLSEIADDRGIKFRKLQVLFEHVGGMQGGASIAIAARPDKGKTSFIASTLVDFAPQCISFFGKDRPILWLNNEGPGKKIVPRVYQAALNKDIVEINKLSNAGELVQLYSKAVGGDPTIIRVKDMHGATLAQIEQVIEAMRPSVVVYDMLANFRLPGGQGGNKAEAIEQAWQTVREHAVMHDFIAISTVQISVEGGNQLFPSYSALKDSKTGIQGATDLILMLGSLDNPDAQILRGISTPKNKFSMPGKPSCVTAELYFDASRCHFEEGRS
jgi:hypothetical protein